MLGGGVAAGASQVDLESWSTYRTPHFSILSNAENERAVEIVTTLEQFRAAFSQWSPELELVSPVPTRILAFRDADSYTPFKTGRDGKGAQILGQFLGHRDGNFITLNADPRFLGGFGVVLHEYVHYLVQHNFPAVPRWLNEGLAEYYSTFRVDGDAALVGLGVERHVHWIRTHDDLRLADLLETTGRSGQVHPGDSDGDGDGVGRFYAVSWGLVHYLLSTGEDRGTQLADFLELAAAGEPPVAAFEQSFDLRLSDLEDDLEAYFLGPSLPAARVPLERLGSDFSVEIERTAPADLASTLGDLVVRQGQEARAEGFYNVALAYEPQHAEAHAGLAYVRDLQSRLAEAELLYQDALELGPADGRTYLLYGRHLLARMEEARREGDSIAAADHAAGARSAFRDGTRVAPEFAEISAMLGYSYLFTSGDPEAGIAPLEKARRLLPGRPDVVFHLLQLHLRLGDFDRARALAAGVLTRIGDEELVFKAREEIARAELLKAANEALADGRHEDGLRLLDDAIMATSDPEVRARLEVELRRIESRVERQR